MKNILRLILTFTFLMQSTAWALPSLDMDTRASATTSEYVFRSTIRENLIPVQVFGAVGKPGLYFVPPKTDLIKLLTLAGGANENSENEVVVRKADQTWKTLNLPGLKTSGISYEVDVKKVLRESEFSSLSLSPQDVVYVPAHEAWISNDTYRTVSVVSMMLSIVLTGYLINQNAKK